MTHAAGGTTRPVQLTMSPAIQRDAQRLRRAVRDSVSSSPGAFLATIDDINRKLASDWINEIRSSTWAVVQKGDRILAIAAAKRPDCEEDKGLDPSTVRFIESVWVAETIRRCGIGRRLVEYLMDVERARSHIQQFLLWIFSTNQPAAGFYENMGFKRTGEEKWLAQANETEIKYHLRFDSAVLAADELRSKKYAREIDRRMYDVCYRVLGRPGS